jgi:hypothetical protein
LYASTTNNELEGGGREKPEEEGERDKKEKRR